MLLRRDISDTKATQDQREVFVDTSALAYHNPTASPVHQFQIGTREPAYGEETREADSYPLLVTSMCMEACVTSPA